MPNIYARLGNNPHSKYVEILEVKENGATVRTLYNKPERIEFVTLDKITVSFREGEVTSDILRACLSGC